MKKEIISELFRMKDLFGYKKGVVISEQTTERQKEAMRMGWGPVTDEYANSLVGTDGKIPQKKVDTPVNEFAAFPCLAKLRTEKKAVGNKTGVPLKIGEGNLKQYMFATDGTLFSYGQEYGKFSCGSKPNTIIINGKEVSIETTTPVKPKPVVQIPKELKDKSGVMKFQDWLDKTHPGWHKKYNTLDSKPERGYGKFGPNTQNAWKQYKDEYLKSLTSSDTNSAPVNKLISGTKDNPQAFNNGSNTGGFGVPEDDGGESYTTNP